MAVPCEWEDVPNNSPYGILKYVYKDISGSNRIMVEASLVVTNLQKETSDADSKYLLSEPGLRLLTKRAQGTYNSFSALKINGVNGGEVIIKNNDYYFYAVQDYFIFSRKLILIQYTVTSKSDIFSKSYLRFFKTLLNKTRFSN